MTTKTHKEAKKAVSGTKGTKYKRTKPVIKTGVSNGKQVKTFVLPKGIKNLYKHKEENSCL